MTDMKFKKMIETIEAYLNAKHGIGYIALSQEKKYALIAYTFHEYMKEQRERQD